MHVMKSFSLSNSVIAILLALSIVLACSCDEQPTGVIDVSAGDGLSGRGDIDPGAGGSFLLGSVSDTTFAPGHIEVWGADVSYDASSGIVSFDAWLVNYMRTDVPAPIHFVVTDIIPRNIAVLEFDGVTADDLPYYDFSDKLGDDGVLGAGEHSERVTMKFHTAEPRSFAIAFRIDLRHPAGGGTIGGVVFRDDNHNGVRERVEPGIPGIAIILEVTDDGGRKFLVRRETDADGAYRFGNLYAGVYAIMVQFMDGLWEVTTPNPLLVTLVEGPDGEVGDFWDADFGLFPLQPPVPELLFGPVIVGPFGPYGTMLDSTFVDPPSVEPVIQEYYLDVAEPPFMFPRLGFVDTAAAWINDRLVFEYRRPAPPDSAFFEPKTIRLPEGLVHYGENSIRLYTDGAEEAALMWRVYKTL